MSTANVTANVIESAPASRPIPADLDSKVISWRNAADVGMLQSFISKPPLRSVVIKFSPEAADTVLKVTNSRNRRLKPKNVDYIRGGLRRESFELTGDTIKFSHDGKLLDGQHRLQACVKEQRDLTSHVVFGLDDSIFDLLDQGRKRTPADVLEVAGIADGTMFASSIRWAVALGRGETPQHLVLSPREISAFAHGPYKGLRDWATDGQMLNKAFHHSPSMLTALLYTIGQKNKEIAQKFAHEWVHGARIGPNKNFDLLARRIIEETNASKGRLNHYVRAALIVETFNAWNAGVELAPRDLNWRLSWPFPKVAVDADQYRQETADRRVFTGLTTNQQLVFVALEHELDRNNSGRSRLSVSDIAALTDLKPASIETILKQLVNRGLIEEIEAPANADAKGVYKLRRDIGAEA